MPTDRPGYTLLEVLVVVMLMAAIGTIAVGSLVRRAAGDEIASSTALLAQFLRQARHGAMGFGGKLQIDGRRWSFQRPSDAPQVPDLMLELAGVEASLSDEGGDRVEELAIDARGRSADVVLTLRAGGKVRRCTILGLIGEWRELDPTVATTSP